MGKKSRYYFHHGDQVSPDLVIREGLGGGSYGEVYEGVMLHGEHTAKTVALKYVYADRYKVEVAAAKEILNKTHPFLIGIIRIEETRDKKTGGREFWIVMDYAEDGSLAEEMERHPSGIEVGQAVKWTDEVLQALSYLHSAGILHRDLKPANVLLHRGYAKIGDYGLAKVLTSKPGTPGVGTPEYQAPEVSKKQPYDHRADLYSVGCIFYELLTGSLPYGEDQELSLTGIPPVFHDFVRKALAPEREARYEDAKVMLQALARVRWQRPPLQIFSGWPFDPAEARRRQCETAEALGNTVALVNSLGMELALIPAGTFQMGGKLSAEEVDERWPGGKLEWYRREHPRHDVTITKPFSMGKTPVTRDQFAAFVDETGYETDAEAKGSAWALKDGKWDWQDGVNWRDPLFEQTGDHPVVCVSWNDGTAFCQWLSKKEGRRYELPREAEWEWSNRAGSDGIWWWGDREEDAQGRTNVASEGDGFKHYFKGVRDGYEYTSPAGCFEANAFGLHDVIGNVWEWCADWFAEDYYQESPTQDPPGPSTGKYRVLRGGSWLGNPCNTRSALRNRPDPAYRYFNLGFRVLLRMF